MSFAPLALVASTAIAFRIDADPRLLSTSEAVMVIQITHEHVQQVTSALAIDTQVRRFLCPDRRLDDYL